MDALKFNRERWLSRELIAPKVSADKLARERLETQLEIQVKKNRMLARQCQELEQRFPELADDFKNLKKIFEEDFLAAAAGVERIGREKQILDRQVAAKEAGLAEKTRLMEELEKKFSRAESQIDGLSAKNSQMSSIINGLEQKIKNLNEDLQKEKAASPISASFSTVVAERSVPSSAIKANQSVPSSAVNTSIPLKTYLARFIEWWNEPVATLSLPFEKKS